MTTSFFMTVHTVLRKLVGETSRRQVDGSRLEACVAN